MSQNNNSYSLQKKILRKEILEARDHLHPSERELSSQAIAERLLSSPFSVFFQKNAIISLYMPIRSEVDVRSLFPHVLDSGAVLALPTIETNHMTFRAWNGHVPLESAAFGLFQPSSTAESVIPDLILAPLCAFDQKCNRLGYGKGYYDQALNTLKKYKKIKTIGLAFSIQKVDHIPCESHDQPLDAVITEKELVFAS